MRKSKQTITFIIAMLALTLSACATDSSKNSGYHKGYFQNHPQSGNSELSSVGTTCYFCTEADKAAPKDSDNDGVIDDLDKCPGTPANVAVDTKGCPLDSDGDGVYDYMDKCPGTPANVKVDAKGCPLDSDGDGVYDYMDKCPGTPTGATVNTSGCWVLKNLNFKTGKADIEPSSFKALNELAAVLEANSKLSVEVQGHTDSRGSYKMNKNLSQARAEAVVGYLLDRGINPMRLTAKGYGPDKPIADNATRAGRAANRRVELKPKH
ncbi:MAG: OmpA family protein [Magnetococcales bacterium]|nr:OmpA family protein [Magnetococcales bacterium]